MIGIAPKMIVKINLRDGVFLRQSVDNAPHFMIYYVYNEESRGNIMLSENLSKLTVKLLNEHSRSLTRRELVNLLRYKEDLSPRMYSELYKMKQFLHTQIKAKRMSSWGKFYYLTDEGRQYFLGDA